MQRVKTATAISEKPAYTEGGAPGYFTKGDPVAGRSATVPGQDWFNMVQEELLGVIAAAGLTPDALDDTQLRQAVLKLILAAVTTHDEAADSHLDIRAALAGINIPAATEAVAGIIRRATNAEALAGTDDATAMSPADVAAVLATRPIIDLVARDQIALTNLRQIINTAVTTGALVQGRMWELLTDEWATGSTGYAFVAGSPGYYTNKLSTTVGNSLTSGSMSGEGVPTTHVDLNFSLPAGQLTKVALYSAYARTGLKAQVWRRISGMQFSFVGESQAFDISVGLNTIPLSTPFAVQEGDNLALYSPSQSPCLVSPTGGRSADINAYRTETTTFGAYSYVLAMQGTVITGSGDMVLVQPGAIALASAPAYADAFMLYKDDSGSAVLGTDLVVEMSRDNGGTWTPAQSYTNETGTGGFDGTYAAIKARCNLSGQPMGTSLRTRIATHNVKAQRVAAPAVYAE